MSENLFGLTVAADKGLDDLQCQRLLSENRKYQEVMLQYRCALKALESRLEILNEEFSLQHDRNPIESMKSRLKSPSSIMNKMHKRGLSLDFPTMQAKIMDVAGVRVICSFEEDVFFTIAMDFWASLEHTIRYKKNLPINIDIFHPLQVFKSRQRKRKNISIVLSSQNTEGVDVSCEKARLCRAFLLPQRPFRLRRNADVKSPFSFVNIHSLLLFQPCFPFGGFEADEDEVVGD